MKRGFTLLEVLISVAIFLLIAGGIFEAVSVSMSASNHISIARLDSERLDSFQRFTRLLFSNLPQDTKFDLRIRQTRGGDMVELLLSPVPGMAELSRNALETGGLSIGAIPDQAGTYNLSFANFDSEASANDRDKQLDQAQWLPALPGVKSIRWRFAPPDRPGLEEIWTAEKGRPVLADLELSMNDGSKEHFQFLIPSVSPSRVALTTTNQPTPATPR